MSVIPFFLLLALATLSSTERVRDNDDISRGRNDPVLDRHSPSRVANESPYGQQGRNQPSTWNRISSTTTAKQISARGDIMPVYIVNKQKDLMRREFTSGGWEKERSNVLNVGAGFDGSAWYVAGNNEVYRGRNGNWQKVDGKLVQVRIQSSTK